MIRISRQALAVHKREVVASLEIVSQLIVEERFYKSGIWKRKRRDILERDHNECQACKREGGFSPANTVHHIKHLKDRPDLALVDSNLESLCAACHNKEHPERFLEPGVSPLREKFPERW